MSEPKIKNKNSRPYWPAKLQINSSSNLKSKVMLPHSLLEVVPMNLWKWSYCKREDRVHASNSHLNKIFQVAQTIWTVTVNRKATIEIIIWQVQTLELLQITQPWRHRTNKLVSAIVSGSKKKSIVRSSRDSVTWKRYWPASLLSYAIGQDLLCSCTYYCHPFKFIKENGRSNLKCWNFVLFSNKQSYSAILSKVQFVLKYSYA